ncbi:MAG TPA: TonB-dependent receptor [Sphingomicrobium sp.]|nr:TonB-dependent receptor [Sphingomicrobium sp.]
MLIGKASASTQNQHTARPRQVRFLLSATAFFLLAPWAAAAQETSDQSSTGPGETQTDAPQGAAQTAAEAAVEDIVVYGRKRGPEYVQDVPLAITAFSGEKLEAVFATDLESIAYQAPNVALEGLGLAGAANFTIRGLGVNSTIPSLDPTVGVFVDGVYLGITTGTLMDFFDIDGIEILRGPQGVLFGKNVTGGAVLLRTRRPGQETTVRGKAGLESGLRAFTAGSVEGPLSGALSGKLVGYYSHNRGRFDNLTTSSKQGKDVSRFVRGAFNLNGEGLGAFLTVEVGRQTGDGGVYQNVPRVTKPFTVLSGEEGFTRNNWKQAIAEITGDVSFGDGAITSITGYRHLTSQMLADVDGLPATLFHLAWKVDSSQFSQELRYAGRFGDFVDVTTGLYYFTQDLGYLEQRSHGTFLSTFGGTQDTSSYAAFASTDFDITPQLTFSAGVRYTRERKKGKIAPQRLPLTSPSSCDYEKETCVYTFSDTHLASGFTPKLGAQWKPNDDTLLYASWTRGLRSGGYNLRHNSTAVLPIATDDEKVTSYEAGAKLELFDRRLRLNLAAFRTEIDDILRDTVELDPSTGGTIQINQNTGDAIVRGIELESYLRLFRRTSANFAVGYTRGKYVTLRKDISGDRIINEIDYALTLPRLAKWSIAAGLNQDVSLGSSGTISARADFSYRSRAPYTDNNLGIIRSAELLDASLTWRPVDERLSLSVYAKNILDDETEGTMIPVAFGPVRTIRPGRTIGSELRFTF